MLPDGAISQTGVERVCDAVSRAVQTAERQAIDQGETPNHNWRYRCPLAPAG
jgi:hypothetical protein